MSISFIHVGTHELAGFVRLNRRWALNPSIRFAQPFVSAAFFASLSLFCALVIANSSYSDVLSDQKKLLIKHGVQTDAPSLIKYLDELYTDNKLEEKIDTLIADMASNRWQVREAATNNLIRIGQPALTKLESALKSIDPEVRWRAERILADLENSDESVIRRSLAMAAIAILKSHGDGRAVETLLKMVLLFPDDQIIRNDACEAFWASVDASHIGMLKQSIEKDDTWACATSIVALEIASEQAGPDVLKESIKAILPLLEDPSAAVRLAAARALIDHRPNKSVMALVQLVSDPNQEVVWKADALLSMKTSTSMKLTDSLTLGDAWAQWSEANLVDTDLSAKLGQRRLDLKSGRNWLDEFFHTDKNSLADGYGLFEYESTNGGKASVVNGRLRIDGAGKEGDQRVFITSERMIGSDRWPGVVEVRAKLGGESGNNYGWHMGLSIGKIKVLFHPGEGKGHFRIEQTDTHQFITQNENLTFHPATGVLQEMTVRVQKSDSGAILEITLRDEEGQRPFNKRVVVTDAQLGDYSRIGLERSGRTGGGALFDSLHIRLE